MEQVTPSQDDLKIGDRSCEFGDVATSGILAMQLDSARELKSKLLESVIAPLATSSVVRSAGLSAQPTAALAATPPTIVLGVIRKGKNGFGLAVRVQKRGLENSTQVESISKRAKGEVDVRYIGQVTKRSALPWHQKKARPLRIGASIGHFQVTAGTLGAFVRSRDDGAILILSNNHGDEKVSETKRGDEKETKRRRKGDEKETKRRRKGDEKETKRRRKGDEKETKRRRKGDEKETKRRRKGVGNRSWRRKGVGNRETKRCREPFLASPPETKRWETKRCREPFLASPPIVR